MTLFLPNFMIAGPREISSNKLISNFRKQHITFDWVALEARTFMDPRDRASIWNEFQLDSSTRS